MMHPRSQRGFTLIEVLVALALMAMIGTILITSLQIGGHTWQRVTRTVSGSDDMAQAQEFLRERLSTLYPNTQSPAGAPLPAFLVADGTSLEFTSNAADAVATGMMRYRVRVEKTSGNLEVQSRPDRGNSSYTGKWATDRLLQHVDSLAIQFWQPDDESGGHWVDHWPDLSRVPNLIRIDLALSPSDTRRWPTLYIEPRVTTPITCQFDPISRQCRSGA